MSAKDLSILIPARNEQFLKRTIEDILEHAEMDTEVLVGLDGEWANPPVPQHPRVNVIYVPVSIGQRMMTNQLCKLSKAKYVMKADAHVSFDQGFDRKMIEAFKEVGDNVIMAPTMRNLWAYDWKCPKDGTRTYQDKGDICPQCGGKMKQKMLWIAKERPQSNSFCFDSEPHFQYFNEWKGRHDGDIVETMSLQGSCFMLSREKYWELNICDEDFGSWGSQGIEIACKFWLSGGRVLVNKRTYYAHMFRTKGNVFGFPYPQSGRQVDGAKKKAKDLFFNNKWDKAIRPLSWLVDKFDPPERFWSKEDRQKLKEQEKMVQ